MIKYFLVFLFAYNTFQKSNVYFTKVISPSSMVTIFKKLNVSLEGRVGLKIHSGELRGKYFLTPDFLEEIYNYTNGTYIECNTAYKGGVRHSTESHKNLLKDHGWYDKNRRIVLMDEDPLNDFNLTVSNPEMISENIVGGHLKEFESCLVLAHLKGHGSGGFGGALKQLSIGFASQAGKTFIHTAGKFTNWTIMQENKANQENFTASMADAASTIVEYFKKRKGIAFINVMANISRLCDCAGGKAPEPKIHDIGILASTDPVAIDRACIDLIRKNVDVGTDEWLTQLNNLKGENTIFIAEKHGMGSQEYELINIDEKEGEDDYKKDNKIFIFIIIGILVFVILLVLAVIIRFVIYKKKKLNNLEGSKNISLIKSSKGE